MASIQTKNGSLYVVYRYEDDKGRGKQKWEPVQSQTIANRRKAQIETQQYEGTFIIPSNHTVKSYLMDFVDLYGTSAWNANTYNSYIRLMNNYIIPILGDVKLQKVNKLVVDKFYKVLQNTPSIKDPTKSVSVGNLYEVNKLMKCAFTNAVEWELVKKNYFLNANLPELIYNERGILDDDKIADVLDQCDDPKLFMAINLSFACTMREGEILGLLWENVFIEDEDIFNDDAHLLIRTQLQRESIEGLEATNYRDIIKVFPQLTTNKNQKTVLVLAAPKCMSFRKVWIPKALAFMLREWRDNQNELKSLLGDEYNDYNLVVCLENGNPCTQSVISTSWCRLRKKLNIDKNVVFHSFRHMSITYKLKLNKGDIKATQGDSGHKQAEMILNRYSHVIDKDRKIGAQKLNDKFYGNNKDDNEKLSNVIKALQTSPEALELLSQLITN